METRTQQLHLHLEARDGAGITLAEVRALLDECVAESVAALLAVDIELRW